MIVNMDLTFNFMAHAYHINQMYIIDIRTWMDGMRNTYIPQSSLTEPVEYIIVARRRQ